MADLGPVFALQGGAEPKETELSILLCHRRDDIDHDTWTSSALESSDFRD